jgi:hypothetical protein
MCLRGQQIGGLVEVHKRPPALREPVVIGPFRSDPILLTTAASEVTAFKNLYGLVSEDGNRFRHMTNEVNEKLTSCCAKWYDWAEHELCQRFGFEHRPEQHIEVKKVDKKALLPSQQTIRPQPSMALRFMRG